MACGARFYQLAVVSALIAILVLIGLGKLSKHLDRYGIERKRPGDADELD